MSSLKSQHVEACVTLLREFIDGVPETANTARKKNHAILALNQLQCVTAGSDMPAHIAGSLCLNIPIMDRT